MPIEVVTSDSLAGTLDVRVIELTLKAPPGVVPKVGFTTRLDGMRPRDSMSTILFGGDRIGETGFIAIEQLEVLRGPTATDYGFRAGSGVVNFTLRKPVANRFNVDVTLFDPYTGMGLWTADGPCDGCRTNLAARPRLHTFRNVLDRHKAPALCGRLDDFDFSSAGLAGTARTAGLRADATDAGIDLLCNWATPRAKALRNTIRPATGEKPFAVDLELAWAHGTGSSNACGRIQLTPKLSGTYTATLEGEGQKLTFGPTSFGASGSAIFTGRILQYGVYDFDVRVTSGGRTVMAHEQLTVTSAAGASSWCVPPVP